MTQTREKWDFLVLSKADFCMVARKVRWCFVFSFFILLCRSNGKTEHLDDNNFRHGCGNYFKSDVLKVTLFRLCSKFFLENYKAHWQRHLKYTSHLKILRTGINMHANSISATLRVRTDFTTWDVRASNSNSMPATISNNKQ